MVLSSESYIFDPRPNYPLVSTAKRYWNSSSTEINDPEALTLIFAHGTGFHKEQFEPAIEDFYKILETGNLKVREVWAIDAPNHGDAAVLNEKILQEDYESVCKFSAFF